jgi:hypothetical protein
MDDIAAMIVLAPPLDEQRAIVEYIVQATRPLDVAQDQARREVSLLREYRNRLIADVVTGRVDVRNAVADVPVEPSDDDLDGMAADGDRVIDDLDFAAGEVEA